MKRKDYQQPAIEVMEMPLQMVCLSDPTVPGAQNISNQSTETWEWQDEGLNEPDF